MNELKKCPVCSGTRFYKKLSCIDHSASKERFNIVSCETCSFLFTNPRPKEKDIINYYDSVDYISHTNKKEGLFNRLYQNVRKYAIRKKTALVKTLINKGSVLDIGCGTGEFVNSCSKNGLIAEGVEPSEKAVKEAKTNYQINISQDISLKRYNDQNFDCVTMWHVLGPGSVAGIFVHEKHHRSDLVRHAGWWGHNKEDRFTMPNRFNPIQSAEGWQLSNPPILSLAAIKSSLSIFDKAGMDSLLYKAKNLTAFLSYLIDSIETDRIEIITPKERGCQLSIRVRESNKNLFDKIINKGVIADWREPDVIRVAPVPLYNSFVDVYKFYHVLKSVI